MTALGEALKTALEAKKKDYSNFIWKGEKKKVGDKYVQESKKIMDMSEEELKQCFEHCNKMLYSDSPKLLGRYNVLKEVDDVIEKCNVELFLRYCENSYLHNENRTPVKRTKLWLSLRKFMERNKDIADWNQVNISQVTSNIPSEFEDIPILKVMDGCIDNLG